MNFPLASAAAASAHAALCAYELISVENALVVAGLGGVEDIYQLYEQHTAGIETTVHTVVGIFEVEG